MFRLSYTPFDILLCALQNTYVDAVHMIGGFLVYRGCVYFNPGKPSYFFFVSNITNIAHGRNNNCVTFLIL